MKNVIRKILYTGLKPEMPLHLNRAIILANAIAVIAIVLCVILLMYLLSNSGWEWSLTTRLVLTTIVALLLIVLFNKLSLFSVSRLLLSMLIPVVSFLIVMIPRAGDPSMFHYSPRSPGLFCVVLVTSVVPLMIFTSRELRYLIPALCINLSVLFCIDPALYFFSADYKTGGYPPSRFLGNNMILFVSEFFLIGSVVFLKTLYEYFEKENEILIRKMNEKNAELKNRNKELFQLNRDIEAQNQEIQAQSEELIQSQESLLSAHHEIERQKAELERQNIQLEESLDAKSKDLLHTNQQLVVQNHELQQFSYTVSHNLRGPVASMLGLVNIYHLSNDQEDKANVFGLLEKSAQSLETVIHDLNKIIDIRKDKFNISENVNLETELSIILQSLSVFITENDVTVTANFKLQEMKSIKAYVNSILYNLISNAIQYRSPERRLKIAVSSYQKSGNAVIVVEDNGLGIDMSRFKNDLFKLYKRFHSHVEGKGLGLYIVKQQVEKLNGFIEVDSSPEWGTRFSVHIRENPDPK